MISIKKRIAENKMLVSLAANGVATVIKSVTGLLMTKIIAVFVGPAGIALVGQLFNFITMTSVMATGGISSGIIKYVAEYRSDKKTLKNTVDNALFIIAVCSIVLTFIIMFFYRKIALILFQSEQYSSIIIFYSIVLCLSSLATFFISVINGYKDIRSYVTIGIISNLVGFVVSSFLVVLFRVYGALLALAIGSIPTLIVSIFFLKRFDWFNIKQFSIRSVNKKEIYKYLKYSGMTLVAACAVPLAQITIRNHIMTTLSCEVAGYWQALLKLSDAYLVIITSSFAVYYLPRLSEIQNVDELKKEVIASYKIIIPVIILICFFIYIFRYYIIIILYSKQFLVMKDLIPIQLIGDFFKITSWVLAYIMIARAMIWTFILSEIFFNALYALLAVFLIGKYQIPGVLYAYVINYILYLLVMIIVFWRQYAHYKSRT